MNMSTGFILTGLAVLGLLPLIFRSSTLIFIFFVSPLLVLLTALGLFATYVFFGRVLDSQRPQRTNPLNKAAKPFSFSTPAAWQAVLTRVQWSQKSPQSFPPLLPDEPALSALINEILTLIVRDFVLEWYTQISSSPSFPVAVSSVLHDSMGRLLSRASELDLASLIVKKILPKVTTHIEQFRQTEFALRGAGLERRLTQSEELDLLMASRYASKGGHKLHPAVENLSTSFTRQSEEAHLRQLVDMALPSILPEKEANSKAIRIVVREILACTVLYPIMEMLGDPDFWNKTIDQVAGEAIHQQKLITKVRNVLESQSPRSRKSSAASSPVLGETITIRTDARQFESFLRSINRCSSLLDARRLKNDVSGEIRRTRLLLAKHEKEEWINGWKTEEVVAFLDRLYTAKRKVEERIVVLGGEEDSRDSANPEATHKLGVTLREILQNPSSLSYFMEFMDRRNRSLLVQFWLTVESFKNPLESLDSDSSGDEDDPALAPPDVAALRGDISMINDLYFSSSRPHAALASIPPKLVENIKAFATNPSLSSNVEQRRARRSVMLCQRHVQREMEQDFEDFERSELWFRAIGDTDFGRKDTTQRSDKHPQSSPSHPSNRPRYSRASSLPTPERERERQSPSPKVPEHTVNGISSRSTDSLAISITPKSPIPNNIDVLMGPLTPLSESSRAPLFDNLGEDHLKIDDMQRERMEAIQAALTDIIAEQHTSNSPKPVSLEGSFTPNEGQQQQQQKRRRVFDDFYDHDEDEEKPDAGQDEEEHNSFQAAGPGDLQLSYEIARLGDKASKLLSQSAMLDTLIKKAELTGDVQELKLLTKSKSALNRELRELNFQKSQYEQQESANRIVSDRTRVSIVSSTVGDEDGRSVVRYLIEVQQLATDGTFASGWVIARRYNEFLHTHNKLRDRYVAVRQLDFPGKRLVTALSGSFVDTRKVALEKYLQSVIAIPAVCESEELRAFLSRDSPFIASDRPLRSSKSSATDLVKNVYRSVAGSIDDMFFGSSMLDVMIERLTLHAAEFAGIVGSGVNDEDLVSRALQASGQSASESALLQLSGDLKPLEGETSTSTFSAPICDLILAIFELNKQNNWLRKQAIVIILQQVLGSTIERKLRETISSSLEESRVMSILTLFRNTLWPGGKLKSNGVPRTVEEIMHSRNEANRKLSALLPDLVANMIGRSNARRGARRIFAVLQNRRLNQHIAYTIMDEVFYALFPESAAP